MPTLPINWLLKDHISGGGVKYGPVLNVSDCINDAGNPYGTFANATPAGFEAISDGNQVDIAGTADEIIFLDGVQFLVEFNLALTGTAPFYNIFKSGASAPRTDEGAQLAVAGSNAFIFTINTENFTGVCSFYNSSTVTDFGITLLSVRQVL